MINFLCDNFCVHIPTLFEESVRIWNSILSVNKTQEEKDLDLSIAVEIGDKSKTLRLLKEGSNPNKADYVGYTSLHYAVERGHSKLIEPLIKYGGDIENEGIRYGYKPLHLIASSPKKNECLEELNKHHVRLHSIDCMGNTLLQLVVKRDPNNVEFIEKLISLGMDPNTVDIIGNNCVHNLAASHFGQDRNLEKILEIFIKRGVDINCTNHTILETPLHIAARRGKSSLVDILCREGATIDAEDINGLTPFGSVRTLPETTAIDVLTVLFKHLVLRIYRGETVSQSLMDKIEMNFGLKQIFYDHVEDLERLKVKVTESCCVSYYDILCGNKNKVCKYLKNIEIAEIVFPNENISTTYRKEFRCRLEEVREIIKNEEFAYKVVAEIFHNKLPDLCVEKISSYLCPEDIQEWSSIISIL